MADYGTYQLHYLSDADIELRLTTGSHLTLDVAQGDTTHNLIEMFVDGATDRERIECALAIAEQIRNAALDLSAQLANGGTGMLVGNGNQLTLPDAAPLHGTQVRRPEGWGGGLGNPETARAGAA